MTEIAAPFQQFFDTSGKPLENGQIFIGAAGADAQSNPILVYWNSALTIPAPQPIRTLNGYPAWNGAPSRLFASNENYSITVLNAQNRLMYSLNDATSVPVLSNNVEAFGAVGDGIADDTLAIQAAINAGGAIFGPGRFRVTAPLTVLVNGTVVRGAGADFQGIGGTQIVVDGNFDLFQVGSLTSSPTWNFRCEGMWLTSAESCTSGRMFVLNNTLQTFIQDVVVTDFANFMYARKASLTSIMNTWCNVQRSGPSGYGILWDGSIDRSDSMFLANFTFGNGVEDATYPMNNRPNGIILDGDVNTLRIQGCALVGVRNGIVTRNTGGKPAGQRFNYLFADDLEIDYCFEQCIQLNNGAGFQFSNIYMNAGEDPNNCLLIANGVYNVSFKNGQITGGRQHGVVTGGRDVSLIDMWMAFASIGNFNLFDEVRITATADGTTIMGGFAGGWNGTMNSTRAGVSVEAGAVDTQIIGVNLRGNVSAAYVSAAANDQITVLGCPGSPYDITARQDFRVDPNAAFRVSGNDVYYDYDANDYTYFNRPLNTIFHVIGGVAVAQFEPTVVKSLTPHVFVGLASDPAGVPNGSIYYNTSTNKLRGKEAGAWANLI